MGARTIASPFARTWSARRAQASIPPLRATRVGTALQSLRGDAVRCDRAFAHPAIWSRLARAKRRAWPGRDSCEVLRREVSCEPRTYQSQDANPNRPRSNPNKGRHSEVAKAIGVLDTVIFDRNLASIQHVCTSLWPNNFGSKNWKQPPKRLT